MASVSKHSLISIPAERPTCNTLRGARFAVEVGVPLYRNLNGPQLETDMTFTFGVQKAF